jgi:hypothetical protein
MTNGLSSWTTTRVSRRAIACRVHPASAQGAVARGRRGSELRSERLLRQSEGASLGVLADCPCLAGVHHAPTERLDSLQGVGDIAHRKGGQGEGIAGAAPAGMNADRGGPECVCQPSPSPSWRASSSTPRSCAQKRRARAASSARNSMSDSGAPGIARTIPPLGDTPLSSPHCRSSRCSRAGRGALTGVAAASEPAPRCPAHPGSSDRGRVLDGHSGRR